MNYDVYGQAWTSSAELVAMLYRDPDLRLENFQVTDPTEYNSSIRSLYAEIPLLKQYAPLDCDIDQYHKGLQANWHMPDRYKELDIAEWVLAQCDGEAELQRCGQELLMFQDRNLFDLLRYLKYLVDTLRSNNIVWGVGRGSSVASFVLYKIGVHRVNSIYYSLDIEEFLK